MKGVILYMSKCGSTKQYAEWISDETGFPLIDLKKNSKPDIKDADMVIIGSWIFADKMVAHGWIKKNWSEIQNKSVVIFSTSGARPDEELRKKFMESSLPENIRKEVSYFPLHGRFRQEDHSFVIRSMLKVASKMDKDSDLAQDLVHGIDGVKKENLREMIEHIKGSEE